MRDQLVSDRFMLGDDMCDALTTHEKRDQHVCAISVSCQIVNVSLRRAVDLMVCLYTNAVICRAWRHNVLLETSCLIVKIL